MTNARAQITNLVEEQQATITAQAFTIERLRLALIRLSNEVAGWREEDLAEVGGWTNTRCLLNRKDEARALLAELEGAK